MENGLDHRNVCRFAIAFAVLFTCAHMVTLPVGMVYDGLQYIDLSDVLGSSRFPREWVRVRTPLFPLALKLSFWAFGRQPGAAILVSSSLALAGIFLVGATVRRLVGRVPGAITIVLLSMFPTLVGFEHYVFTEAGSFFFIAFIVYLLVLDPGNPARMWAKALCLVVALTAGYYWRSNVLVLAPVAALFHGAAASKGLLVMSLRRQWRRFLAPCAQVGIILAAPYLLASLWNPYSDPKAVRDLALEIGMIRQALLPPEHPLVGANAPLYYRSVRESIHNGEFYSGLRFRQLDLLQEKIFAKPIGQSIPSLFLDLIRKYPDRYFKGLVRTLVCFSGVDGAESEMRAARRVAIATVPNIEGEPDPTMHARIRSEFEQRPVPSALMHALARLTPVYDSWVIAANLATLAGFVLAILLRDARLLACYAVPLVYVLSYAVFLWSLDRYVVPVTPIILADSIMVSVVGSRLLAARMKRETPAGPASPRRRGREA